MRHSRSHETVIQLARATLLASALACGVAAPSPAAADAESVAPAAPGVVNINTATAEELQRLPGVGPSRANAIIAQRTQRPFGRIEEIMRVKGIGRATFRTLRPMLTIDGPTTLQQAPARPPARE